MTTWQQVKDHMNTTEEPVDFRRLTKKLNSYNRFVSHYFTVLTEMGYTERTKQCFYRKVRHIPADLKLYGDKKLFLATAKDKMKLLKSERP